MTKNELPLRLKHAPCPFCGLRLTGRWIPNRGPVMAHPNGRAARCREMRANRRDLVSRANKRETTRG